MELNASKRPYVVALLGGLAAAFAVISSSEAQQTKQPVQVLVASPITAPVDHPFNGVIEANVDASDVARKFFTVRLRIPVQRSGDLTLLYPRWEAGSHGPSLTVTDLAGLQIAVDGRRLPWRRDRVEPHAFHLKIPAGARIVEATYQIMVGAEAMSPDLIVVPWQRLLLYPAGWYARNLPFEPTVIFPTGLKLVTALDRKRASRGATSFATVSFETLLDSPVYAARYLNQIRLTAAGAPKTTFDLMAAREDDLRVSPERINMLRRMVDQAMKVFGPAPFQRYDFLVRMEDDASAGGIEHRRSSEISLPSTYFREWGSQLNNRDIIAHEFVHSWNGLYRTPADLWAPTPNVPQGGSLLWAYEGQTEFWGRILAARAGLRSHQETLDQLALDAAVVANRPGRSWRSLSDDVNYPSFMLRKAVPWQDWQRRKDYYVEGVMLWLHIDALLRERSAGRKGMDDFASRFFAGASFDAPARTYGLEDLYETLNAVTPADWSADLHGWLDGVQDLDTNAGLVRHGWRLVYTDIPTPAFVQNEEAEGMTDLSYSLGLAVADNGTVRTVAWDGPAFKAGLAPRAKIVAVHRQPFSKRRLTDAVHAARTVPVQLTIEQDGRRLERTIPYSGSLRYPRLERIPDKADTLTRLLSPR